MELFLKGIFEFFTDRTIPFVERFLVFFVIVITLVLVNDILGFSFYYNTNHKLNQLKIIYELYPKSMIDNNKMYTNLNNLEIKVVNRNPFLVKMLAKELSIKQKTSLNRVFSASVLFLLVSIIYVFNEGKNKVELENFCVGMTIILIAVNSIQAVIPDLSKNAYNYAINFSFSVFVLVILGFIGKRNSSTRADLL